MIDHHRFRADWIDANQLGRRNLKPDQTLLLMGRRYNRTKHKQGGTGANQHTEQRGQIIPAAGRTAEVLAKEHGVNARTIKRAGRFAAKLEGEDGQGGWKNSEDPKERAAYEAVRDGKAKFNQVRREIKTGRVPNLHRNP